MGNPNSDEPRPVSVPSAPQMDEETPHGSSAAVNPVSPPPNYGSTSNSNSATPTSDLPPPPPYSDAINYPAPPYVPAGYPKIPGPQHGQPMYPPPISGTGYVLQAPAPASQHQDQPRVIHTTTVIAPIPGTTCIHCLSGQVQNETDICCLMCLIIFAIFTFPFGLALLCCIPCTVRQRCSRCRRLQ